MSSKFETILILDFGGQYTQLIGRRIREANVYTEIVPFNTASRKTEGTHSPKGLILVGRSGIGLRNGCSDLRSRHFQSRCSGSRHLLWDAADRQRSSAAASSLPPQREYGSRELDSVKPSCLLNGMRRVWMSHGDRILEPPPGLRSDGPDRNTRLPRWKIRSEKSSAFNSIPKSPTRRMARHCCADLFSMFAVATAIGRLARLSRIPSSGFARQIGDGRALCAISGGVDSTVAGTLVSRAIGDRLVGVFVNTGLLRKNEFEKVLSMLQDNLHLNVRGVDASDRFLNMLCRR